MAAPPQGVRCRNGEEVWNLITLLLEKEGINGPLEVQRAFLRMKLLAQPKHWIVWVQKPAI